MGLSLTNVSRFWNHDFGPWSSNLASIFVRKTFSYWTARKIYCYRGLDWISLSKSRTFFTWARMNEFSFFTNSRDLFLLRFMILNSEFSVLSTPLILKYTNNHGHSRAKIKVGLFYPLSCIFLTCFSKKPSIRASIFLKSRKAAI